MILPLHFVSPAAEVGLAETAACSPLNRRKPIPDYVISPLRKSYASLVGASRHKKLISMSTHFRVHQTRST